MNLLMINGSPNYSGNTNKILDIFTEEINKTMKSKEFTCKTISLSEMSVAPCRGCRVCFNNSEALCPHKDDVGSIKSSMDEADIIIIGSPVYVEDVTGLTKNWIDRMAYSCHRPFLYGKLVYIFTTSGAGASTHAIRTLKNAFIAWGAQIVNYDNYSMGVKMNLEETEMLYAKTIKKRIDELIYRLDNNRINLYSLIAFYTQKQYWNSKKIGTKNFDYKYWSEKGWLMKDCDYYRSIKVNNGKKYLAKIISKFVGVIMHG